MAFNPEEVIFPLNRIRRVIQVFHDGTQNDPEDFSIAELEFTDGTTGIGIRHNYSYWNENNPDLGSPTSFGRPAWFILPPMDDLLPILNQKFGNATPVSKP